MAEKEIQLRKKREVGDIITDSFAFLKQEIKPISKLFVVYVLPFVVIYSVIQVYVQMNIMGKVDLQDPEMVLANLKPIYLNVFFSSLFALFVQSLLAGTYYTYIDFYVKKGKGNFEFHEISQQLFGNSLIALGANLMLFFIVIFGIIMCVIPGIYMANTLSIVLMIVIFERKGIGHALTRSWNLVHTQWWNTFLINLVGIVIIYVVSLFFSIPAMITGITSTFLSLQETGTIEYPTWYWVILGISSAVSSVLIIIVYTFQAFQYFNLDERTKPIQPPVHNLPE